MSAVETLNTSVGRQFARDTWGAVHPVLHLSDQEMTALGEYSTSIPTGKTIGKRWRRRLGRTDWCVGEYAQLSEADQLKYPGEIAILWYLPSVDGAAPGQWSQP